MIGSAGSARFDDALGGNALVFDRADQVLVARHANEVRPVLAAVEQATAGGAWAWGYLAYEAAAGLDAGLPVRSADGNGTPLAAFAVGPAPRTAAVVGVPPGRREHWCSPWQVDATPAAHRAAVQQVQERVAAGDVYQVNHTTRVRATLRGDLDGFYAELVQAQHGRYNARLSFDRFSVLSASPELFFEWAPPLLSCRPMKGTARRSARDDAQAATALRSSAKDLAENVMIVDLVRNDLGRLARMGTVRVPRFAVCEPYGSVWQLSSDVRCEPRDDVDLTAILTALFPSGSITGAPKASAMGIIAGLEAEPRGVYCGTIGWVAPPDHPVRARFNVAIRTVVVDHDTGRAVYGAGGGITAASDAAAEYDELLAKTAVLGAADDPVPLELLETLRHDGTDLVHLDRHLRRVGASAAFFGIPFDADRARHAVSDVVRGAGPGRVRLRVGTGGELSVEVAPLPAVSAGPVRLAVDGPFLEAGSLWRRHKTNRRDVYAAALARNPGVDDVLLVNTAGQVVESTVATVAVQLDGRWWTPPLESGALPGVGRAIALEEGRLAERAITVADLRTAGQVALVSSLRGWRPAVLAAPAPRLSVVT